MTLTLTLTLTLILTLTLNHHRSPLTFHPEPNVSYLQETKFKEAIRYYEPVVKKQQDGDNILSVPAITLTPTLILALTPNPHPNPNPNPHPHPHQVPAIVLANLCVAYIMTSQNEEAEELMRRVEKEEERGEPDKQVRPPHLWASQTPYPDPDH